MNLGERLDDLIGLLENLPRLGRRDAGEGGRHVEQVAFVERRHELGADVLKRKRFPELGRDFFGFAFRQRGDDPCVPREEHPRDDERGGSDDRPAPLDDEVDDGVVEPEQEAINGILFLRAHSPAKEKADEHRRQGDGEQRGRRHRVGLGEGKRLEHAAFLLLQRKDREERDRHHQQGVEDRRPDLDRRIAHNFPMGLLPLVVLHVFMRVLD